MKKHMVAVTVKTTEGSILIEQEDLGTDQPSMIEIMPK
jgi:hypothetical protein